MAQVKIYNLEGAPVGSLDLDDKILAEVAKPELLYQVVRVLQGRARTVLAHSKDRSQVRGGGKKPWKQKGTGRARHGSIRSPIWKGGGVTFGPTSERNFWLNIPRKMMQKAMRAVFASKVKDSAFWVCDDFKMAKPSTKKITNFLKKLNLDQKKVLFLSDKEMANAILSVGNLPKVAAIRLENLNLLDLMKYEHILIGKESVPKLVKQISR
ncbi:MAG: 50S ribosomal protein L4 [Candidatus Komeilibacteria bacterium]|nr:50S ribosomal protein L4 [Candidatus Komeilibacteria bacterium]